MQFIFFFQNKKLLHFKVFYDTPGSTMERATGFELEVNKDTKIMKTSLISPWKKARFTGKKETTTHNRPYLSTLYILFCILFPIFLYINQFKLNPKVGQ